MMNKNKKLYNFSKLIKKNKVIFHNNYRLIFLRPFHLNKNDIYMVFYLYFLLTL